MYIPYHHCTFEDIALNMYDGDLSDWEYIEEQKTWWIPQGWYEIYDYNNEYSYSMITDKVVAWMKLPRPYKPRIKDLNCIPPI